MGKGAEIATAVIFNNFWMLALILLFLLPFSPAILLLGFFILMAQAIFKSKK